MGRDRDTTSNGTLDERLYAMQDANWNVVAVATPAAVMQERYAYSPYGVPVFLTPTFGNRTSSSFNWETLYCSYRYEAGTGLCHVRRRMYHAHVGTWIGRDPLGLSAGSNLYEYCNSLPTSSSDPSGTNPACIGAAIAGAGFGLGFSLFSSWLNGETPCQTTCKAFVNFLVGAFAGCLGTTPGLTCLAAALAAAMQPLGNAACDAYCGCKPNTPNIMCNVAAGLVGAALSCFGAYGLDFDKVEGLIHGIVTTAFGGSVGNLGSTYCSQFNP